MTQMLTLIPSKTQRASRCAWIVAALLCAVLLTFPGGSHAESTSTLQGTIRLAGRSLSDSAPYSWSVVDLQTQKKVATVSRKWGMATVPAGFYKVSITARYHSVAIQWQQVSVQAGKVVTVRVNSGIDLSGRSDGETAPYEWYVYNATTNKKVGRAYKRWGFMPLPPGKYRVALKQRYYSLPINWSEVTVQKAKVVAVKISTGIRLGGRSDKDPALYEWTRAIAP